MVGKVHQQPAHGHGFASHHTVPSEIYVWHKAPCKEINVFVRNLLAWNQTSFKSLSI